MCTDLKVPYQSSLQSIDIKGSLSKKILIKTPCRKCRTNKQPNRDLRVPFQRGFKVKSVLGSAEHKTLQSAHLLKSSL